MVRKLKFSACAVTLVALMASSAASAFSDDEARKAILDLREKVVAGQNAQLQLATQIEQLSEQNAELMGRVERLSNEIAMQRRSVRDLFANLDKRIGAQESTIEKGENGTTFTVLPEEKRRYDIALELFSEGEYVQSERLLDSLLTDFPKSGYAVNALYWIGCSYFAQNRLEESIEAQLNLINRFPKSVRVPEAMLSKAAAEASLGRKSEARTTLNQIIKKFPKTDVANLAKERLKTLGPSSKTTKKSSVRN